MSIVKDVNLTFEVHCQYAHKHPRYRIYVDDDLITERTFIWGSKTHFIEENLVVRALQGEYSFKLENVDPDDGFFTIKNIRVDGVPTPRGQTFDIV